LHIKTLKNEKVAVIGGGRAGLAAAALLRDMGALPFLVDDAPKAVLEERLHDGPYGLDLPIYGGGLKKDYFDDISLALLSPGVPRKHPVLAHLLAHEEIQLFNEVELAYAQTANCSVVGITGSNGKSTTTTLTGALLKQMDPDVFLGGNLGTPFSQGIMEKSNLKTAVLELSSYQLETITQLPLKSAVITNLSPDHLDRYVNLDAYYDAKWRITQLICTDGWLTLNDADDGSQQRALKMPFDRQFNFNVSSQTTGVSCAGTQAVVQTHTGSQQHYELAHPHLIGTHNISNACAALAVAHIFELVPLQIEMGFQTYSGMPHRMERVGEHRGVVWVNDSKATNVEATKTAIESFEQGIHLFAGGVGKGSDYAPLTKAGRDNLKSVYVFGEERVNLKVAFEGIVPVVECDDLKDAVEKAGVRSSNGDVFLLSPACASFDQYRSFEERGDHFKTLYETQRQQS